MSGLRVDLDREFMKRLQENLNKEKKAMLDEIATVIQTNVRGEISQAKLVDTGHLRNSIQRDVKTTDRGGFAVVGSNALYVLPLELGIQKRFYPSKDMISALTAWSKRKLGLSDKEAKKAGPAIAWKIARKGLDPSRFPAKFFEKGFMRSSRQIPDIIERFTRRAAALTNVGTL